MRISLGVIVAIILIVYWYRHDHPQITAPVSATQGYYLPGSPAHIG